MKKNSLINIMIYFVVIVAVVACKNEYTPRPKGYHRITFPEKEYKQFNSECPYTFEYPVYGKIMRDSSGRTEPCWINIVFPEYNGKIHISYKDVNGNLSQYVEDSRTLAYKHTIKAEAINERVYRDNKRQVYGILYNIKGNVASSAQFFVTDSSEHFIRGALYFRTRPNKDSLAPVIDFFRKDIIHLIETVKWKK